MATYDNKSEPNQMFGRPATRYSVRMMEEEKDCKDVITQL